MTINFLFEINRVYTHFMNILFTKFFVYLRDLKWLIVEYYD